MKERSQEVINFVRRRLHLSRIASIRNLSRADQHLLVPGDDKDGSSVQAFCIYGGIGCTREPGQDDVRSADTTDHRLPGLQVRILAQPVYPGPGSVDDPSRF